MEGWWKRWLHPLRDSVYHFTPLVQHALGFLDILIIYGIIKKRVECSKEGKLWICRASWFRQSAEVGYATSWSVSADSVYKMWQTRALTLLSSFMLLLLLLWLVMLIYSSGTPASSCSDSLLYRACDSISCHAHYVHLYKLEHLLPFHCSV